MNYYELDDEEKKLLEDLESGGFKVADNQRLLRLKLEEAAKSAGNKTRNINIRIPERDLFKLKEKAAKEGVPYQTLAASIIHKQTH